MPKKETQDGRAKHIFLNPIDFSKAFVAVAALLVQGCVSAPPPTVPIRTIRIETPNSPSDTLVVMLPGVGDRAEQFIQTGFVGEGIDREYDLLAVDGHLGYYLNGSIDERLREDVIEPATRAGYRRIWLLGVSLGGFGSLLYAEEFSDDVEGIVLLAPYLGSRRLVRQIMRSGGLEEWSETSRRGEPEFEVWRWLKEMTGNGAPELILAYGASDSLAPTYRPLLEVLPKGRIYTINGGHGWETWTELWSMIEASGAIR